MSSSPHSLTTPLHQPAVPAWGMVLALLALFGFYLIAQDNGTAFAVLGEASHEFFHDARHSLGMPCH